MGFLSFFIVLSALGISMSAYAEKATDAKYKDSLQKMIPDSKVIQQDGAEYEVMTPKQTVVEIEFNRDGSIDEASGDAAQAGDVFNPGEGMITLADAVAALSKAGKTPSGDWSYEKSLTKGWIYEFEGTENGKKMEYAVSAKDGKIVKDNRDIL